MNLRLVVAAASMLTATACGISGTSRVDSPVVRPDKILDFNFLYSENCAGCHGHDGSGGLARALADPVYLAIADDTVIRTVTAKGVSGTVMPAFARSSGGSLTDPQIDAIISGIRTHWAKPGALAGATPPPYATDVPGDPARGAMVYESFCASCHGANGRGGERASSIVDPTYLALVSDQSLRTTVIAGRRDLASPDWRNDVPGKPMTNQDVSDVVAWLVAQRPQMNARR
jgi:cytochrome c oxidase cbb3-type subunit III